MTQRLHDIAHAGGEAALPGGGKGDVLSEGAVCVLPAIHATLALLTLSERLERDFYS